MRAGSDQNVSRRVPAIDEVAVERARRGREVEMFPVPRHGVAAPNTAGRVWWCGIGVAGRAKAVEAAKTAALGAEPVVPTMYLPGM